MNRDVFLYLLLMSEYRLGWRLGHDHAQVDSARRVSAHLVSAQITRSCAPARPWRGRRGVNLRRWYVFDLVNGTSWVQ